MTDPPAPSLTCPPRALATAVALSLLTLSTAAVWLAIRCGADPNAAATAAIVVATPLLALAERRLPHAPRWAIDHGDLRADLAYALGLTPPLGAFLLASLSLACLGRTEPLRLLQAGGVWPHGWPLLAQAALIGLGTDLVYYAWHRLCHATPALWRFHAVHHAAPRVYVLNAFRFHPVDSAAGYVLMYAPVLLAGASLDAIALYTVFDFLFGSIQHSNLALRLGPLNWVLAGPELHRWHHSARARDRDANYGNTWIVWDVLFGTRHLPGAHDPADVGFEGSARYPKGFVGQLIAPFRRP